MRLFGKRANTQPGINEVPPELRPYYREQAVAAHAHRVALRFLVVFLVLIVLVGGGVWGGLHEKNAVEHLFGRRTTPSSAHGSSDNIDTATNNQQNSSSSTTTNTNTDTSPATPAPTTSDQSAGPSAAPTTTPSTDQTQSTTPTAQPANNQAIPNTGPGTTILIAAIAIAVGAMIGYQVYQRWYTRS